MAASPHNAHWVAFPGRILRSQDETKQGFGFVRKCLGESSSDDCTSSEHMITQAPWRVVKGEA
jgi:hypothetical protein